MKIKLALFINNTYQIQDLHEDFAGVTTFERFRCGEFRVKKIDSVSFGYDGTQTIYAHPLDRDVPIEAVIEPAAPVIEAPLTEVPF